MRSTTPASTVLGSPLQLGWPIDAGPSEQIKRTYSTLVLWVPAGMLAALVVARIISALAS